MVKGPSFHPINTYGHSLSLGLSINIHILLLSRLQPLDISHYPSRPSLYRLPLPTYAQPVGTTTPSTSNSSNPPHQARVQAPRMATRPAPPAPGPRGRTGGHRPPHQKNRIGQYIIERTLGTGSFGKVKRESRSERAGDVSDGDASVVAGGCGEGFSGGASNAMECGSGTRGLEVDAWGSWIGYLPGQRG
jgi:hypothetical protein